jgi:serine/threonine protein kinase
MALTAGTRLGIYEILAPIGEGGMGEVYRARDTKLERDVAIKVLPAALAQDPERLARFEREAKVLASLNHPNIAQIYGVEESALVMELVPGESIHGPLPLETALNYAKQIADALEAAHDKGIIHRDLKPANIMVTPTGVVKVLDFGLAAVAQSSDPSNPANSPTLTISPTRAGMILGTAAYMSPEQAAGKPVDKRADIWSFGVVLYEMLTGQQLYAGATTAEILASVMKDEPSLDPLPPAARSIVDRCLRKDPRKRWQAIGDVRLALEEPPDAPAGDLRSSSKLPWILVAFATVAVAMLGFVSFRHFTEEKRILKLSVLPPEKATFSTGSLLAVSPDGRRLAFVANDLLWVRDLDSLSARPLPGTEGAAEPFWSPDSRFIAFFADGRLKKTGMAGSPVLTLCDAPLGRGGSWSKDDVIVFAPNDGGGLSRVAAAGGIVTQATELDQALSEASHRLPWFLPDGRHFLYTAWSTPEKTAVYLAELDSKTRRRIVVAVSNAVYSPPGYLLFLRERTLMAQPFDAGKAEITGDPVPVADQIDHSSYIGTQGQFSLSQNGVLAYTSGIGQIQQLTWFNRYGKVVGTVGTPGTLGKSMISPAGNAVVVDRVDLQTGLKGLWEYDLARGTASRLTFNSKADDISPIWSPDGSHIAFSSSRDGGWDLFQKAISGPDEILDKAPHTKHALDWSNDGRYIIEEVRDPKTSKTESDIWVLPLFGDRKPFPFLHAEFNETGGRLSPNGRWLAYFSDETKSDEVYVQTFPIPGGKWQVSTNGGAIPVWSRDGKELFFIGADQRMMVVEVNDGAKFEASVPKPLFQVPGGYSWFDVSKDLRFLIPTPVEQSARLPITVVINWTAGLKN